MPADVDVVGADRIVDRARHRAQRRLVEDALDARDRAPHVVRVAQVALDQLEPVEAGQVLAPAGGEVVEDAHAVAAAHERLGHVRPDEARAAGDEIQLALVAHARTLRKAAGGFKLTPVRGVLPHVLPLRSSSGVGARTPTTVTVAVSA